MLALAGYVYTKDLLQLGSYHPRGHSEPPLELQSSLSPIATPLNLQAWRTALSSHPDRQFTSYILSGIETGLGLGLTVTKPFTPSPIIAHQQILTLK